MPYKQPLSVLVLVHTSEHAVLLLERADYPEHWQSVTGSVETGESPAQAAVRELAEETGIDAARYGGVTDWRMQNVFEIFEQWRNRYPPGTTHNTEHVFGLEVPGPVPVRVAPREHLRFLWLPWREAARQCFSWTNRAAVEALPAHRTAHPTDRSPK
ncbi:MAG: dihydroneopterin triphosphate diphosphatase [Betaproteobacteria bacterium]